MCLYVERETHNIQLYMSIYRDGRFLLLCICILNVFPEQLLRIPGTTMIPILKTDVKGTL